MSIRTPALAAALALALAVMGTTALAEDALEAEYAAMRAGSGTQAEYVRCGAPCGTPCVAPCDPNPCDDWSFEIGLLGWLPGLDGTLTAGGNASDIDMKWTDWFDHLDKLESVFQGMVHVEYRDWWLEIAGMHMVLGDSVPLLPSGRGPTLDAEITMAVMRAVVGRDIGTTSLGRCGGGPCLTYSAYAGIRYYSFDVDMTIANAAAPLSINRSWDWVDPIVGARGVLQIGRRWSLIGEADIGGFGVASDFCWHLRLGARWRAARWFSIEAGWNVLDVDYATGSGASQFAFDVTMSGPYVGFIFNF